MTTPSATHLLRDHPSAVLLAVQLFAVLAYPFFDDSPVGRGVLGVVGTAVVLIALWAVRRTPALSWVAVLLGGPAMVFTVLEAISPSTDAFVLASAVLHAPFYFYVSYGMIRYLFHDDRVTRDELYATGAAFTVVAWGFAYLYVAAQVIWPGSFTGVSVASDPGSSCCSCPSPR
jgi:membrane-bound ClpP family serine protease